ncbi:MAG: PCRF domain-containing protein, partial [Bdellovibrionales bacterium]|nr:PCRF domain-containing protein [Bdellovibrionales bacterium]
MIYGGIFDIEGKTKRIEELDQQAQNPSIWNSHKEMQKINSEKVLLDRSISDWSHLNQKIEDSEVLLEMADEAGDENSFEEVKNDLISIGSKIKGLELKVLMSGETDQNSAYL